MMDKFAVIRSLVGAGGDHSAGQCLTGYTDAISKAQGGRPSLGAVVRSSRARCNPTSRRSSGCRRDRTSRRWGNPGDPGYLGLPHAPFTPFRAERRPRRPTRSTAAARRA